MDIDYTDKDTIQQILRRYKRIEEEKHRGNELAMIVMADMERALDQIELTDIEQAILELYPTGMSQQEIADIIGIRRDKINRHLNRIVAKLLTILPNR